MTRKCSRLCIFPPQPQASEQFDVGCLASAGHCSSRSKANVAKIIISDPKAAHMAREHFERHGRHFFKCLPQRGWSPTPGVSANLMLGSTSQVGGRIVYVSSWNFGDVRRGTADTFKRLDVPCKNRDVDIVPSECCGCRISLTLNRVLSLRLLGAGVGIAVALCRPRRSDHSVFTP